MSVPLSELASWTDDPQSQQQQQQQQRQRRQQPMMTDPRMMVNPRMVNPLQQRQPGMQPPRMQQQPPYQQQQRQQPSPSMGYKPPGSIPLSQLAIQPNIEPIDRVVSPSSSNNGGQSMNYGNANQLELTIDRRRFQ